MLGVNIDSGGRQISDLGSNHCRGEKNVFWSQVKKLTGSLPPPFIVRTSPHYITADRIIKAVSMAFTFAIREGLPYVSQFGRSQKLLQGAMNLSGPSIAKERSARQLQPGRQPSTIWKDP
jgi:hypothetical protein